MTKNDVMLDQTIRLDIKSKLSGFEGSNTKTTMFLLRGLDIDIYNLAITEFLVNAYISDTEYTHTHPRPVFVLFKTKTLHDPKWLKIHRLMLQNSSYVDDYIPGTQDGGYLMMYLFNFPEIYASDYFTFKRGQYSQFSKEYKDLFPAKVKSLKSGNMVDSLSYGIINKTQNVKDIVIKTFELDDSCGIDDWEEIWDIPRKDVEYYRTNSQTYDTETE